MRLAASPSHLHQNDTWRNKKKPLGMQELCTARHNWRTCEELPRTDRPAISDTHSVSAGLRSVCSRNTMNRFGGGCTRQAPDERLGHFRMTQPCVCVSALHILMCRRIARLGEKNCPQQHTMTHAASLSGSSTVADPVSLASDRILSKATKSPSES